MTRSRRILLMLAGGLALTFLFTLGAAARPGRQAQQTAPAGALPIIVLPPVLVAGQPATLAVLNIEGRPAAEMTITLSGDVTLTTDATGRAAFTAPNEQGVLRAALPDGTAAASATIIAAPASPQAGLRIDSVARMLLLRDRFILRGAGFHGIADENRVLLAGQPAALLAASPVSLVALPDPATALGETKLVVEAGGLSAATEPVSVILIALSADRASGMPGEKGEVRVSVQGTTQPVRFEVRAQPADRIDLARGNPSRGRTSGGADNHAAIGFTFREPGGFYLEVRRVAEPLGLPDTDAAKDELEQALQLAPSGWKKRVAGVMKLVDRHPQDVAQARDAIEKLLAKKPEGEFGLHLEAAWKILLNRE